MVGCQYAFGLARQAHMTEPSAHGLPLGRGVVSPRSPLVGAAVVGTGAMDFLAARWVFIQLLLPLVFVALVINAVHLAQLLRISSAILTEFYKLHLSVLLVPFTSELPIVFTPSPVVQASALVAFSLVGQVPITTVSAVPISVSVVLIALDFFGALWIVLLPFLAFLPGTLLAPAARVFVLARPSSELNLWIPFATDRTGVSFQDSTHSAVPFGLPIGGGSKSTSALSGTSQLERRVGFHAPLNSPARHQRVTVESGKEPFSLPSRLATSSVVRYRSLIVQSIAHTPNFVKQGRA